jgi:hypothetical protein
MRRLIQLFVVAMVMAPVPALALCVPTGPVREAGGFRGGLWGLQAPDGSALVWSNHAVVTKLEGPMTRLPSGAITGSGMIQIEGPYCPIDWSADSRYLLAREVASVVLLDQFDRVRYRALNRDLRTGQAFDPQPLRDAIEGHWLAKGRDVAGGGGYYLQAVGWEGSASNRVVLTAVRRAMSLVLGPASDGFLGYWSAEITGLSPRLLAEGRDGFVVSRFGKYVGGQPPAPVSAPAVRGSSPAKP